MVELHCSSVKKSNQICTVCYFSPHYQFSKTIVTFMFVRLESCFWYSIFWIPSSCSGELFKYCQDRRTLLFCLNSDILSTFAYIFRLLVMWYLASWDQICVIGMKVKQLRGDDCWKCIPSVIFFLGDEEPLYMRPSIHHRLGKAKTYVVIFCRWWSQEFTMIWT